MFIRIYLACIHFTIFLVFFLYVQYNVFKLSSSITKFDEPKCDIKNTFLNILKMAGFN